MNGGLGRTGALIAALCMTASVVACKRPPKDERRVARTIKASIAEFDPNADIVLDLNKYGNETVDEWLVQQAFNGTFGGLDACVATTKQRLDLGDDATLQGDVDFAVKLNPKSAHPFAVNASLSNSKLDDDQMLKDCLRDAVAAASYPTYDGPPTVAEFSTQLDPGFEDE